MSPYFSIWLHPKKTFEQIANKPTQSLFSFPVIILACIFLIETNQNSQEHFHAASLFVSLFSLMLICIGASFLMLTLLMPGVVYWVGKIWNGAASMRQMANVYVISFSPFCLILIYQLILKAFGADASLESLNLGVKMMLGLWSFSLLIIGVSKVQRFTYGMALLNILIGYLPWMIIGLLRS